MMKKLFLGSLLGLSAVATMNTYVGFGGSAGMVFSPEFNTTSDALAADGASYGTSEYFEVSSDSSNPVLKSKSSKLGAYPISGFVTVAFLMDNLIPSASFGLIVDAGYRHVALSNETWATAPVTDDAAFSSSFSMKPDFSNLFAVPKLAIGMDTSLCHVLLTFGIDISRAEYEFNVQGNNITWKQMTYGFAVGIEGIFQIAPCVGVGVGVVYTYWPEAWNNIYGDKDATATSADSAKAFGNGNIANDADVINASWHSIALKLAVYMSL